MVIRPSSMLVLPSPKPQGRRHQRQQSRKEEPKISGGAFDYSQYVLIDIADQIQNVIDNNDSTEKDQWGDRVGHGYSKQVIEEFAMAVRTLRRAHVYAQRADWLLSSDDGEDDYLTRLAEDLEKLK